jgi:hypothetical protein
MDKTTSKGTIQGYDGIAINDDKHQIILQAQTWGSVGEQQTLQPAIEQLNQQLDKLSDCKNNDDKTHKTHTRFTADSGFNSEDNLAFMAILTSLIPSLEAETPCLKKAKPITQKKKSAA